MNRIQKLKIVRNRLEYCQRIDRKYYKQNSLNGILRSQIKLRMNRRAKFLQETYTDPMKNNTSSFLKEKDKLYIDSKVNYMYAMYKLWQEYARYSETRKCYYEPILKHSAMNRYGRLLDYGDMNYER
jgi:hypothetical protein